MRPPAGTLRIPVAAAERGDQLRQGLAALQRRFPQVGEVRGLGLMTAMDVVKDRAKNILDPEQRDAIEQAAFRRGLLLLGCGEAAVRFCPPLCITAEQVQTALQILGDVLAGCKAKCA
jgi:4-aminobutyrate aminotransferase